VSNLTDAHPPYGTTCARRVAARRRRRFYSGPGPPRCFGPGCPPGSTGSSPAGKVLGARAAPIVALLLSAGVTQPRKNKTTTSSIFSPINIRYHKNTFLSIGYMKADINKRKIIKITLFFKLLFIKIPYFASAGGIAKSYLKSCPQFYLNNQFANG